MTELSIAPSSGGPERRPGETLELLASWSFAEAPASIEARLFWHTRGKGTPDVGIVASQPVEAASPRGERRLRFKLPDAPYSFSGRLITLAWAVELVAGDEHAARWEFVMAPDGREVLLKGKDEDAARVR